MRLKPHQEALLLALLVMVALIIHYLFLQFCPSPWRFLPLVVWSHSQLGRRAFS